jgi:hypothetical protein
MSNLATTNASQLQAISNGVSIRTIDDVSRMSKMFSASGFFSDCNDAAKAGVKIMAGHELGIQPFAAMSGIHIIKGKATNEDESLWAHLNSQVDEFNKQTGAVE